MSHVQKSTHICEGKLFSVSITTIPFVVDDFRGQLYTSGLVEKSSQFESFALKFLKDFSVA